MKKHYSWLYRNSLSLVFVCLFLITLIAQAITGFKVHNSELEDAAMATLSFKEYLNSGHFISATFENFESEFLQMALYVVLTISLRQIGSSESKKIGPFFISLFLVIVSHKLDYAFLRKLARFHLSP